MHQYSATVNADWMGPGTVNTTSFTPFAGAYMHFFFDIYMVDTAAEAVVAEELQRILAPHVTGFYPYANLANDPDPGTSATLSSCMCKKIKNCLMVGFLQKTCDHGVMIVLIRHEQPADRAAAHCCLDQTMTACYATEPGLAFKVGGTENLRRLQHLKYLLDPDNLFVHHQLQGLVPASSETRSS